MATKRKKKEKEKKIGEYIEEIELMGQDSEDNAVKYVQEVGKREEQESKQENDDSLNKLDLNKKSLSYSQILVEEAQSFMGGFDIPKGFTWGVLKSMRGIIFWYRTPQGKTHARANTICLVAEYDMNGVVRKVFKMIDEMEKLEEKKF